MNSHTVCTMVSNNEEIKVLLLGGHSRSGKVLSDCWLLDVLRGIGEKVRKKSEGEMQLESMICCPRSCLMVRH